MSKTIIPKPITKENFLKLIELMDYKHFSKKEEIFLKYTPKKAKFKKENSKKEFFNNPFNKLKEIQIKWLIFLKIKMIKK